LTGNWLVIATRELKNPEGRDYYHYRVGMDGLDLGGIEYLVFAAQGDHANVAFSNPVFIKN
jgi:hypothetical protein